MPPRLTYERLMQDDVTQKILSKYLEKRTDILRWKEFKDITDHMTLQRRLDRLCEFEVLEKVDKNKMPIKGGKSAPETYYLFHRVHWKRAIWSSDMKELKGARVDKLSFWGNVSVYGMDESDFEGMDKERKQYEFIVNEINKLVGALRGLKMRVVQKKLRRHSEVLEKCIKDPLERWMAECYLWGEVVVPLYMPWEQPGRRFLEDVKRQALQMTQKEDFDDDVKKRVEKGVIEGLRVPSTHQDVLRAPIKDAKRFLDGVVVCHVALRTMMDDTDLSRTEAAFEVFLESGKRSSSSSPILELLPKYTRDTHRYSVKKSRASLAMGMAIKEGGIEFFKRFLEMKDELDRDFFGLAFKSGYLNPPAPPTLRDLRNYWANEGK